jgi:hypothetical protein
MDIFTSALASLGAAVRAAILGDIEVSPPIVAWRTVRGTVTQKALAQDFEGMSSQFADVGDTVEFDMIDFLAQADPVKGWLVRFTDELGVIQIKALAGPLSPSDTGPRFQSAALVDLDLEDPRRP